MYSGVGADDLLVTFGALVMKSYWADNRLPWQLCLTARFGCGCLGTMLGTFVKRESGFRLECHAWHGHGLAGGAGIRLSYSRCSTEYRQILPTTWHAGHAGYSPARAGRGCILPVAGVLLGLPGFFGIGICVSSTNS